ncbi:MAG: hypothetical protein L0Y67_09390 [Gammaproteobacteria bacterium]|nr:hypothetical protein [Gammaproteobacteria bacterium]MCI0591782.1 hypothetical protein [Gammaproteobacteria bacterium]
MYRSAAIAYLLMLSWPNLMTLADTECSGLDCTEAAGGAQKAGEVDVTMAQPDALAQCWPESTNRTEVGPCLAAKQEVADAVLAEIVNDVENQARRLNETYFPLRNTINVRSSGFEG